MKKQEKGITLIALIITIVVLLILAAVAINAIKDGGILDKANETATLWNQKQEEEQTMLNDYEKWLKQQMCSHKYNADGVCEKCEYSPCKDGHTYVDGVCTICGHEQTAECQHNGETSIENLGDGTHKIICLSCNKETIEEHSYENMAGAEHSCTVCKLQESCTAMPGTIYWVDDGYRDVQCATCSVCGREMYDVGEICWRDGTNTECTICANCKHTNLTIASLDANKHGGTCPDCGKVISESHSFQSRAGQMISDHYEECEDCEYQRECDFEYEWFALQADPSSHEYVGTCLTCGGFTIDVGCYEDYRNPNCAICKKCDGGHKFNENGECENCGYFPCEDGHSLTHYTDNGYKEDEHQCEVCGVVLSAYLHEEWYNTCDPAAHTSSLYCDECGLLEEIYGTCSGNGEAYDDPDCLICAHCSGHYYESEDINTHKCSSCGTVAFHILNSSWTYVEDQYGVNYGTHYGTYSCDVCGLSGSEYHGDGSGPAACTLCNP